MRRIIFIICIAFSIPIFGQSTYKYYSYSTTGGNQKFPELTNIIKETTIIFVNEYDHSIDIYLSNNRSPVILKYAYIDAEPEITSYRLYENKWGWASILFLRQEDGLNMACIPNNKNNLTIVYGPLYKTNN